MKEIRVASGEITLVDDEDYAELAQYHWHMSGSKRRYVARKEVVSRHPIKQTTVFMHRQIMQAPPHLQVDHRSGDTLDNQRANLRLATHQQQMRNKRGMAHRSRFKGVWWHNQHQKWIAATRIGKRTIYFGLFADEESAARAYDAHIREYHGEFAWLNFPKQA